MYPKSLAETSNPSAHHNARADRPTLHALALMLLTWLALATVPEEVTGQIVTSENTIWSTTLTAGQTSDTLTTGYADGTYTHNAMGSLTNTMFTYAGIRYTVRELVVHDIAGTYQLDFVLDKTWSHTNTALVMGSNAVALSGIHRRSILDTGHRSANRLGQQRCHRSENRGRTGHPIDRADLAAQRKEPLCSRRHRNGHCPVFATDPYHGNTPADT